MATGASVANLYYAQPLLGAIGSTLRVSAAATAVVITASQVGYAIGLLLIVPLGDLLERRRLVPRLLIATALALAVAAAAPSLAVLAAALAMAGVTSVVAQVVVPMASQLSPEDERGRVVGVIMSGLLIGILLARTVSGLVAQAGSWRVMFWLAAGAMLILAAALWRTLPGGRGPATLPYRQLLRSVGTLVRTESRLRRRMFYGACGMASFSVLWTALALLLSRPPFGYGEATIGLFGLAGVAGAAAAQAAGRLADAGRSRGSTGGFLVAIVLGWGALALGTRHVAPILVGIVILDLGVQGQHILNQSTIFGLRPDTQSRVNTAYMTSNFIWGAIGSAGAAAAWSAGGWHAVCAIGGGVALIALAGWVHELREARRVSPPAVDTA